MKRVSPFSTWQTMVEERRILLGLSTRALAEKLGAAGQRIEHTSIWAWLRHPDGVPPAGSYSHDINRCLAEAWR